MLIYREVLTMTMKVQVILEKQEEGGYAIYVPSLPGCVSQGETRAEALKNIKEAIELYVEADENELARCTGEPAIVSV